MGDNIIWKNARHSAKDYMIYMLTILLSLSLVYAFNLVVFSQEILSLSSQMNAMTWIVIGISFIVVWVIGWLIHYMSKFMIEKRSKEFGTYLLLGVPNKTIAAVYIKENLLMGGIAFLGSLIVGACLYQILSLIIVNLFHATYQIHMFFSLPALGLTFLYTILMYGNSMYRMRRFLRKVEIQELLYAEKQSEKVDPSFKQKKAIGFLGYLGIAAIGCVIFYLSCQMGADTSFSVFFMALAAILVGVYGIYTTVTTFLTRALLTGDRFKYENDRLFLLRGLTSKLSTIGKTMGTLALLLTLTLTSTQLGVLFERYFTAQSKESMGFEVAVSSKNQQQDFQEIEQLLEEHYKISWKKQYPLYFIDNNDLYDILGRNGYVVGTPVLAWSDFQELWAELGYKPLQLKEDQYILVGTEKIKEITEESSVPEVSIGNKRLSMQECRTESFNLSSGFHGTGFAIVVPDSLAKELSVYHTCLAIQTVREVDEKDASKLGALAFGNEENGIDSFSANAYIEASKTSIVVIFAFSLFYIGLIFACTAATILAIQQLSDAVKYQYRYKILSQLGMNERKIGRLILKQMVIYFFVPVCIPIPLSIFLSMGLNKLILLSLVTTKVFFASIVLSIGLFLFIYMLYFVATYLGYKKRVMEVLE